MYVIKIGPLLFAILSPAWAQDWRSALVDCAGRATDVEIAKCVKEASSSLIAEEDRLSLEVQKAEQEKEGRPKIFLRDTSSSVADFTGVELGDKGATLSLQRKDGSDASIVKAAAFAIWQGYFDGRVQPFVGLSWLRDTTGNTKKDIRDVTVGSVGPLWQSHGEAFQAFTLLHTLQFTHREDLYGTSAGNLARLHFDLNWPYLSNGRHLWGFSVLPHVAGIWHDRKGGGQEDGLWRSAYMGVAITKPIEIGQQRLKASLIVRKLYDLRVPAGNLERRDKYANLSLDWFFYDPQQKTAVFQPSFFLSREVGTDFLSGIDKANKTTVGMRFKFN